MKLLEEQEMSGAGKPQLVMYINKDEAEILKSIVQKALQHLPKVPDTDKTRNYLRNMSRTLGQLV